ncbi:Protein FAR1-RELATED SEQUENCE 5 [Glycine max]|nr:Protein FAR1-RELATED SEQUENCE 5 [Glycine max]
MTLLRKKKTSSVESRRRRLPRDSTEEGFFRCLNYTCGRKLLPWSLAEDVFRETPRKKLSSAADITTAEDCFFHECSRNMSSARLHGRSFLPLLTLQLRKKPSSVYAMSEEVDMDFQDEEDCGVNEAHVDCSDAFNTSQVFATREDVLKWARMVAHENGFVAVIMRSDTYTGSRGRTSFVSIGCERSGKYKCRKKEFVRRDTGTRKCGCPFLIHGKPVHGGEGWAVKLICGIHNHELAKTLVGHPYAGRLTNDEKNIIADMTKSNVKPRNILLTLKEHNSSSCTTIKQIYNARSAYRSSIRGDDTEMKHLMRLLERDQYIHWHRLKDEDVVRDLFWCHPDVVKLCNTCNLVFLIDSTYKKNRYRLPLLDIVGVTPTGMTFSAGSAYLEGERVNNLVWALKRFHMDKNVKAKCKSLIGQKNAWDYVMDSWDNLVDCPSEQEFPEHLQRFQVACSPWPMFVDYNSVRDLYSVWDAMNNMMTLQHTEIRASFETSLPCACELQRYDGGSIPLDAVHMYWRRPNFSDQGLCEAEVSIKEEIDRIHKRFEELDVYGKVTFKSKL